MIYILAGVAKAGKTYLSNIIRKQYNLSVFSSDYIMMMLHKGNKDLKVDIHASDSSVARKIEPYLYGLIETMIQNDADYLIEGVHFNIDFSKKLLDTFKNQISIVYIGYRETSVEKKVAEIHKYKEVMDNPWLFDHQGEKVEDIIEYLISESDRVYKECMTVGLDYIEIKDVSKQKEEIISRLLKNSKEYSSSRM